MSNRAVQAVISKAFKNFTDANKGVMADLEDYTALKCSGLEDQLVEKRTYIF